jgi:hypothetical protein
MRETKVKEILSEFQTKLKAELKLLVEIQKVEKWLFAMGKIQCQAGIYCQLFLAAVLSVMLEVVVLESC